MLLQRIYTHLDYRIVGIIVLLMVISLSVISATDPTLQIHGGCEDSFWTVNTLRQANRFMVSWLLFFGCALLDYHQLRRWVWLLYLGMLITLVGLFCVAPIHGVHRWYRFSWLHMSIQPSEWAKIISVMTLSWFVERAHASMHRLSVTLFAFMIMGIPAWLIYKQPDLGTALVLILICMALLYLGGAHRWFLRVMSWLGLAAVVIMLCIFLDLIPFEKMKPFALRYVKEYQYDRLCSKNHHQRATQIAIGVGGIKGTGWRSSLFTARGWLPYAYTDSVFAAFGEERGLLGVGLLLVLFYWLIVLSFEVITVAKDELGRFIAAGIAVYIATHVLINITMMCGLFPVTGIPLILVSYGGSSLFVTMSALGVLQSIYSRRFIF